MKLYYALLLSILQTAWSGPVEEEPRVYGRRDGYTRERRDKMSIKKGERVTLKVYLHIMDKKPYHRSVGDFTDGVWRTVDLSQMAQEPNSENVWNLGIRYAKESLWAEEGAYRGFCIDQMPSGEREWMNRSEWKYEIGWCGQNASYTFRLEAIRLDRQNKLQNKPETHEKDSNHCHYFFSSRCSGKRH